MPTAAALSRWETGNNLSAHQEGPGKENITPHPCCAHHAAPGKTGSRGAMSKRTGNMSLQNSGYSENIFVRKDGKRQAGRQNDRWKSTHNHARCTGHKCHFSSHSFFVVYIFHLRHKAKRKFPYGPSKKSCPYPHLTERDQVQGRTFCGGMPW